MPPARRWGRQIITISSTKEVVAVHGLQQPKQTKQIKEKKAFLLFEMVANPEEVPPSSQL